MAATFFGPGSLGLPSVRHAGRKTQRVVDGVAPPGWEQTVKKMKKSGDIDNPFALAWWLKKRGVHPAKHGEDASFDAKSVEVLAMLGRHDLPAVCYAAARGEAWAQAELLATSGQVYGEMPR